MNRILTWACIVGGALTIADYWSSFLQLPNGAQALLKDWVRFLQNLWMPLGDFTYIRSEMHLVMALSLILFYYTITVLSTEVLDQEKEYDHDNEKDFSMIYLIIATVLFISTVTAFIANYKIIFSAFDNIAVCFALLYIINTNMKIIGSISYTAVYTVLDDYIKLAISAEREFGAVLSGQLISVFVVFLPLLLISDTSVLTRRIANMLIGAGIILGFDGGLRLLRQIRAEVQSTIHA